jgi:hypothetical protein
MDTTLTAKGTKRVRRRVAEQAAIQQRRQEIEFGRLVERGDSGWTLRKDAYESVQAMLEGVFKEAQSLELSPVEEVLEYKTPFAS